MTMASERYGLSEKYSKIPEFGIENALAAWARNRWPANTLAKIEREWGLTNGEARGVLYGYASKSTINKILRPRTGGWVARLRAFRLGVHIVSVVTEVAFDQFLEHEQERLRDEQEQAAARDSLLRNVVSFRPPGSGLGG